MKIYWLLFRNWMSRVVGVWTSFLLLFYLVMLLSGRLLITTVPSFFFLFQFFPWVLTTFIVCVYFWHLNRPRPIATKFDVLIGNCWLAGMKCPGRILIKFEHFLLRNQIESMDKCSEAIRLNLFNFISFIQLDHNVYYFWFWLNRMRNNPNKLEIEVIFWQNV